MKFDRLKFIGLRVSKGISKKDLAEAVKISRATIAKWEREKDKGGITPDLEELTAAAKALGVTPDDLVIREDV